MDGRHQRNGGGHWDGYGESRHAQRRGDRRQSRSDRGWHNRNQRSGRAGSRGWRGDARKCSLVASAHRRINERPSNHRKWVLILNPGNSWLTVPSRAGSIGNTTFAVTQATASNLNMTCANCSGSGATWTPSLAYSTPLPVTTTSANTAFPSGATTGSVIKVYNQGTSPAYWTLGTSGVTATTADAQLAPYSWDYFTVPSGTTNLAAITRNSGQTATVTMELGTGTPEWHGGPINLAVTQAGATASFYDVIGGFDNSNLARVLQATAPGTSATNFALGVQGVTGGVPVPISGSVTASFSQFAPNGNYSTPLPVGATSARTTLPAGGGSTIAVYNTGANAAFVQLGSSSVVATASDDQVAHVGFLCFAVGSHSDIAAIETAGADNTEHLWRFRWSAWIWWRRSAVAQRRMGISPTTGTISTANVFGTGLSNVGNGVLTGTATANSQITSTGVAGYNTVYVECSGLGSAGNSWYEFDKTGGGGGANQWKRLGVFTGPNFSGSYNTAAATGVALLADKFGSATPNCQFRGSVNLATLDASNGPVQGTLSASLAMSTITTTLAIAEVPGLSIAVTGWTEVTSGAATADGNWQFISSGTGLCVAGDDQPSDAKELLRQ